MSNAFTTIGRLDDHDDDGEGYLMIDARALILDLPDEVRAATTRPPLRGAAARLAASAGLGDGVGRSAPGVPAPARAGDTGAATTVWSRLGRRLQQFWPTPARCREERHGVRW